MRRFRRLLKRLSNVVLHVVFVQSWPFVVVRKIKRNEAKNPIRGRELLRRLKWEMVVQRELRTYLLSADELEAIAQYLNRCNVRI
jgi:hypothetical protein